MTTTTAILIQAAACAANVTLWAWTGNPASLGVAVFCGLICLDSIARSRNDD